LGLFPSLCPNKLGIAYCETITDSDRLAIRDAQFVRTQTREQAQVAVRDADQKLSATINALAQKYKIDPRVSDFNMVTLEFMDKKK
jgi:hypothetical protein